MQRDTYLNMARQPARPGHALRFEEECQTVGSFGSHRNACQAEAKSHSYLGNRVRASSGAKKISRRLTGATATLDRLDCAWTIRIPGQMRPAVPTWREGLMRAERLSALPETKRVSVSDAAWRAEEILTIDHSKAASRNRRGRVQDEVERQTMGTTLGGRQACLRACGASTRVDKGTAGAQRDLSNKSELEQGECRSCRPPR
jgi:hypothetical protein